MLGIALFQAPRSQLTAKSAREMKQLKQKENVEELQPTSALPTTVLIPRPVYEQIRALQRQIQELQHKLTQQKAETQPNQLPKPEIPTLEVTKERPIPEVIPEESAPEVTDEKPIPEVIV
jgi:hypothetical protein